MTIKQPVDPNWFDNLETSEDFRSKLEWLAPLSNTE